LEKRTAEIKLNILIYIQLFFLIVLFKVFIFFIIVTGHYACDHIQFYFIVGKLICYCGHFLLQQSGERIRIAYEKKCKQLRNFDAKGEDPSCADKARAAIRDLDTQITVSIHSVEAISRRIETLRDEELYPQLLELVQGYV